MAIEYEEMATYNINEEAILNGSISDLLAMKEMLEEVFKSPIYIQYEGLKCVLEIIDKALVEKHNN